MNQRTVRLDRLVGNGQWGGGMPLPLLFTTVLDLLQEHGERTIDDLRGPVERAVHKPDRLGLLYPDTADPWGDFVRDGLEQLAARRIVERDGERWRLGPKFRAGEQLLVIPARKGKSSEINVLVHPSAESEAREADERRKLDLISLRARLRRDAAGLRPLDEKHVATLVESITAFGWLPQFPVLVDQDDHVLDGRHRIEAARRAGVPHTEARVIVDGPAEALAIAWAANEGKAWSVADRKRFAELLAVGGTDPADVRKVIGRKAMQLLIEARLREHPEWADRRIANKLGCSHHTVIGVRTELEATGQIAQLDSHLGEDGKWRKVKRKTPAVGREATPREGEGDNRAQALPGDQGGHQSAGTPPDASATSVVAESIGNLGAERAGELRVAPDLPGRQVADAEREKQLFVATIRPLLDDLKAESKKNTATMSPGTVARLAAELEGVLVGWDFATYGKRAKRCRLCGEKIVQGKIVMSGKGPAHWTCQQNDEEFERWLKTRDE